MSVTFMTLFSPLVTGLCNSFRKWSVQGEGSEMCCALYVFGHTFQWCFIRVKTCMHVVLATLLLQTVHTTYISYCLPQGIGFGW